MKWFDKFDIKICILKILKHILNDMITAINYLKVHNDTYIKHILLYKCFVEWILGFS